MSKGPSRTALTVALVFGAAWVSGGLPSAARSLPAQTSTKPSIGLIVGRVVDASSNASIAKTIVALSGQGISTRRVIVDPQGRFMFTALPAGAFTITSTKSGYLDGAYGKLRPDGVGRPLDLREGERVTDATVKMWRSATISGTVTDDAGDPVSNATVQVWRRMVTAGHWRLTSTGRTASPDERGVYRVISLPPGDYAVVITSLTSSIPTSLMVTADAARRAEGTVANDFLRIAQTNGTAGFVNDLSQGFPAVRVGDVMLQTSGSGAAPTLGDGRSVNVYPTVWYPSAPTPAQATYVTLGPGDNRTGIDLRTTLASTVRVSGVVTGPDGPVPYLSLRLVPAGLDDVAAEVTTSLSASFTAAMTASDGNGAFTFLAVTPGQYILRALTSPRPIPNNGQPATATVIQTADGMTRTVSNGPPRPPMLSREPSLWMAFPISAGDMDVSGLSVTMRPGLHVTGRVEFDGATTKPTGNELRAIRVSLEPADGRTVWFPTAYQAQIDPDGGLYTTGLMAGSYFLRVDTAPTGWTVKSAIVAGRDICDAALILDANDVSGLVLTFTQNPSRVSGSVRDSLGRADDSAAVLIFPSEGPWTNLGIHARRLQSARSSRAGGYAISGLPPGNYDIVAVSDGMTTDWQDPAFLQKLARIATHVSIRDAQSLSVDLTTAVVR